MGRVRVGRRPGVSNLADFGTARRGRASARAGAGNDAVSSVLVAPGLKVTLFEHNLFQGWSRAFVASPTSYVGDDFNDAVSSLIVEYI